MTRQYVERMNRNLAEVQQEKEAFEMAERDAARSAADFGGGDVVRAAGGV